MRARAARLRMAAQCGGGRRGVLRKVAVAATAHLLSRRARTTLASLCKRRSSGKLIYQQRAESQSTTRAAAASQLHQLEQLVEQEKGESSFKLQSCSAFGCGGWIG